MNLYVNDLDDLRKMFEVNTPALIDLLGDCCAGLRTFTDKIDHLTWISNTKKRVFPSKISAVSKDIV